MTNVSGRGVGMDVVRRHIQKLRGRIEIRSTPGQGTTFLLKLPLTLAIIDGLVVGVGQERYIVPLFAVREMFRPTAETIWTVQKRAEMALVRGSLLPVVRLYRRLRRDSRDRRSAAQAVLIVAEVEGQRFCLLVDELIGKQEVVIKTLGETFKNVAGVAGGAILGDGRVGLILDLDGLFKDEDAVTRPADPAEPDAVRPLARAGVRADPPTGLPHLRAGPQAGQGGTGVRAAAASWCAAAASAPSRTTTGTSCRTAPAQSLVAMIDALATNHTSFLREPDHFEFLRDQVLPGAGHARPGRGLERGLFHRRGGLDAGHGAQRSPAGTAASASRPPTSPTRR